MRLALVISSAYAENPVVARRDAFPDNAAHFAERFGSKDAAFEVIALDATRDLPETLEELLRSRAGQLESLLVHFTGYIAVKADRGPALLLDGNRLRAFPLSRLRAAVEDGAQQALVIIDGLAVVDSNQPPDFVAKSVGEALAGSSRSIAALVGIEFETPTTRRGPQRLTDLLVLALDHLATKARGGLVSGNAAYQAMQSDVMSFADIAGVDHHAGYFDFVILQGPSVGGIPGHHLGQDRATQPVPIYSERQPLGTSASAPQSSSAESRGEPATVKPDSSEELPRYHDDDESDPDTPRAPPMAVASAHKISAAPLPNANVPVTFGKAGERRVPTLADTPRARAADQRDWVSSAAYFPSAPPPPITSVKPGLSLPPPPTYTGIAKDEAARPASSPRSSPSSSPDHAHTVIEMYEELLAQLDASEDPRRAEVQTKLGDALRDAQRNAEALFAYERALDIDPLQPEAFEQACELYQEAEDFAGLVSTIRRRLDASDDQSERLAFLDQIAAIWLSEAMDVAKGIVTLQERLAETPEDVGTLQQLVDAQDRMGNLPGRLDSRERLAESQEAEPELRAAAWVEAATLAHNDLDDLARTVQLLESAVKTGVLLPHALTRAELLLGGRNSWLEVVRLFELALETATSEPDAVQVAMRLVGLIREQSCQNALKPGTLSTIATLAQRDAELAEAVVVLVESVTRGQEKLELLQCVRVAQPRNVSLLHTLVHLSHSEHPDIAINVASVLVALGEASDEERELAKILSTDTLPTPSRSLEQADYESLVFPMDLDRDMTLGLARLEKSLFSAGAFEKKDANGIPKDAPVVDTETSTITLARSFLWTSRLLSVKAPELILLADAPTLFRFVPQAEPRLLVWRNLGSGFALPELVYLAARHSALQLPGFVPREHCADPGAFGALLFVLAVVADGRKLGVRSLADSEQKLGKRLLSQLEADESLEADVERVVGSELPSIEACEQRAADWLRAVDQVRLRAALLSCGTPSIAIELNRHYPLESLWSDDEQIDLLTAFAGSPEHCELRSRLEIAAERNSNFST